MVKINQLMISIDQSVISTLILPTIILKCIGQNHLPQKLPVKPVIINAFEALTLIRSL